MGAERGVVRRDPAARRAVAGFAADSLRKLEARAALGGRGGRRVAAEAGGLAGRIADPEGRRDLPPAQATKHRQRAAVRACARRGLLPGRDLVLANDLAVAFGAAVAGRAGA